MKNIFEQSMIMIVFFLILAFASFLPVYADQYEFLEGSMYGEGFSDAFVHPDTGRLYGFYDNFGTEQFLYTFPNSQDAQPSSRFQLPTIVDDARWATFTLGTDLNVYAIVDHSQRTVVYREIGDGSWEIVGNSPVSDTEVERSLFFSDNNQDLYVAEVGAKNDEFKLRIYQLRGDVWESIGESSDVVTQGDILGKLYFDQRLQKLYVPTLPEIAGEEIIGIFDVISMQWNQLPSLPETSAQKKYDIYFSNEGGVLYAAMLAGVQSYTSTSPYELSVHRYDEQAQIWIQITQFEIVDPLYRGISFFSAYEGDFYVQYSVRDESQDRQYVLAKYSGDANSWSELFSGSNNQPYFNSTVEKYVATSDRIHRFYSVRKNDPNWRYEGQDSRVVDLGDYSKSEIEALTILPVHRFWSETYKHHFYTISEKEKKSIVDNDPNWAYEGVAYYSFANKQVNTVPVYRFYSPTYKGHFYTTSQNEKEFLEGNDPNWQYEGIAWYSER